MVKILNIVTNGLKREGITTSLLEIIKNMDLDGIQMDIASVYECDYEIKEEFKNLGCRVIQFPNRSNILKYIFFLVRQFKMETYDVIHVHGSSAIMTIELLTAKMCGIKKRIAHSRNTKCINKVIDQILRPIFYVSYTDAIACGEEAGKWLFGNRKFDIFYNGKDLDRFKFNVQKRADIRSQRNLNDKYIIGFVGNIKDQKNPVFLLDVIKECCERDKEIYAIFLGDGEMYTQIQNRILNYHLKERILMLGRVKNVDEFLSAFDLLLLPSKYEGLPNVILEAQINGLCSLVSSQVTQECKITNLVKFLPINLGKELWVDTIINNRNHTINNRIQESKEACKEMRARGFDIKESANLYRGLYLNKGIKK